MRVLVIGASGYVGSRIIPELLHRGHTVLAGARDPDKLHAFWWCASVRPVALDVTDSASVSAAFNGSEPPEAVVYLVHGMDGDDFREIDLQAARRVRRTLHGASIGTLVYVSGIIPEVPREDLSEHLLSRLEVEEELARTDARFVSLRAAIILGAGSTSFELMTQLARRLPVTVVPDWMNHRVEPVAVTDIARAVCGALENPSARGAYDLGCGEQLAYPELVQRVLGHIGAGRASFRASFLPHKLVGKVASLISDVPSSTVRSLMESLSEDMVTADVRWIEAFLPFGDDRPVSIDEALRRAVTPPDETIPAAQRDPLGLLPGDPNWARGSRTIGG